MKITVYTIADCQFSKQEKDYLTANKLTYEEKNLDSNKEFLTEMLTVSNNFAGTPVTKIEKDDGQIVVLKGFTKEEFDKALGLTPEEKPEEKKEAEIKPEEPVNKQDEALNEVLQNLQAKSAEPQAFQPTPPPAPPIVTETPSVVSPVPTAPTPTESTEPTQETPNLSVPSSPAPTEPPVTPPPPIPPPAIPDFPSKT